MAKSRTQLIVKSGVHQGAKGMNVSKDAAEALNTKANQLLQDAMARAKANGRRTVQGRDF